MPLLRLEKVFTDLETFETRQEFLRQLGDVYDKVNDYHRDCEIEGEYVIVGPNGLDTTPAASIIVYQLGDTADEHITASDADGLRFYDTDGTTVRGQLSGSDWTIGNVATENIQITATAISLRDVTSVYASLSGGTLILGLAADEHLTLDNTSGIRFYDADGTTVRGSLTGSIWTIGSTSTENILVNTTSVQLRDTTTVYLDLTGGVISLGQTASEHVNVTSTSVQIKDGSTVYLDLTGGVLTLGDGTDKLSLAIYDGYTLVLQDNVSAIYGPQVYTFYTDVITTNNTATTLLSIPTVASVAYHISSLVTARRYAGSAGTADDMATYVINCSAIIKAGTLTIMSSPTLTSYEDQAGWNCAYAVSGANLLLRVTGATNNSIAWTTQTIMTLAIA